MVVEDPGVNLRMLGSRIRVPRRRRIPAEWPVFWVYRAKRSIGVVLSTPRIVQLETYVALGIRRDNVTNRRCIKLLEFPDNALRLSQPCGDGHEFCVALCSCLPST